MTALMAETNVWLGNMFANADAPAVSVGILASPVSRDQVSPVSDEGNETWHQMAIEAREDVTAERFTRYGSIEEMFEDLESNQAPDEGKRS